MSTNIGLVAMGASWGGLHAGSTILSSLPPEFPAAIMLVQHQNASAENRLDWLLRRCCRLPVTAPQDKAPILPGRVYVAPPGYHMLVNADRTVALSTAPPVHFSRPSIDELFFSAGHVYGAGTVGVILTGANEDGSAGLDYIRRRGGLSLAQSPRSSEAPAMPEAAMTKGAVQEVLDLEQIGPFLVEHLLGLNNEETEYPGRRRSPGKPGGDGSLAGRGRAQPGDGPIR